MAVSKAFQGSNHSFIDEKWSLDSLLHLGFYTDSSGGTSTDLTPSIRASYKVRNNLTADTQLGIDRTWTKSNVLQSSSTTTREFVALGFSLSF
jgi:hypothetical protein